MKKQTKNPIVVFFCSLPQSNMLHVEWHLFVTMLLYVIVMIIKAHFFALTYTENGSIEEEKSGEKKQTL